MPRLPQASGTYYRWLTGSHSCSQAPDDRPDLVAAAFDLADTLAAPAAHHHTTHRPDHVPGHTGSHADSTSSSAAKPRVAPAAGSTAAVQAAAARRYSERHCLGKPGSRRLTYQRYRAAETTAAEGGGGGSVVGGRRQGRAASAGAGAALPVSPEKPADGKSQMLRKVRTEAHRLPTPCPSWGCPIVSVRLF